MKLGRRVVGHDLAAARLLLRRVVGREVGRDDVPLQAVVRRLEHDVAAEVRHARVLSRERDGRVPVEAVLVADHRVAHRADAIRIRIDGLLRTAARVGDIQHAALRIAEHEPRLVHHRHAEEPIAAGHGVPVDRTDPLPTQRVAGPAPGAVILQPAAHAVRHLHVVVDVVELGERKGVHHVPIPSAVATHLPSAVAAVIDVPWVHRVNPHRLMVTVHVAGDRAEVQAAVLGEVEAARERKDPIRVLRVHADVGVVERAEADVPVGVHGAPRLARVVGTPQLSLVLGLADHVHDIRIARRHSDTDAVHRVARQAQVLVGAGEPLPRGSAVHRLPDSGVAGSRLKVPSPAAVRVHPRVDDVAVGWVGRDIGAGRLRIHVQDLLPVRPAVGGLVDAAVLIGAPLAPEDAGVDDVRVLRVDDEARDLVRLLEADVRPVIAAVDGLVHAVAHRRVVARIPFARADVDDVLVARRDGHGPNGASARLVEDRGEGVAAVRRLDDAAVCARHVVGERVARHADDLRDAPGVVRRSHGAPRHALEERRPIRRGYGERGRSGPASPRWLLCCKDAGTRDDECSGTDNRTVDRRRHESVGAGVHTARRRARTGRRSAEAARMGSLKSYGERTRNATDIRRASRPAPRRIPSSARRTAPEPSRSRRTLRCRQSLAAEASGSG